MAQIEITLGNLPAAPAPFKGVFRDRGILPEDLRPCVVLLDSNQTVVLDYPKSPRGFSVTAPHLVEIRPQIFALLKVRELAKVSEYGPELSQYNLAILSALFNDQTLKGLVGTNGRIGYRSTDTDMQTGSTMQGQLQVTMAIQFVLRPEDLQ